MTHLLLNPRYWLLPVLGVLVLIPGQANAAHHHVDYLCLRPAAERLHAMAERFEAHAHQAYLPRHEVDYIRAMGKKACRLCDVVANHGPYGQIQAEMNVLKVFVRVIDLRLQRRCEHELGLRLMHCWTRLKRQLHEVECVLDGCDVVGVPGPMIHGHPAVPPVAVHRPVQPAEHIYVQPYARIGGPVAHPPMDGHDIANIVLGCVGLFAQRHQAREQQRLAQEELQRREALRIPAAPPLQAEAKPHPKRNDDRKDNRDRRRGQKRVKKNGII